MTAIPSASLLVRLCGAAVLAVCLAGAGASALAQGAIDARTREVRLTSLEWPPYTGSALPAQGRTTAVVRAALAAMGYRLRVDFFPWSRAVALVRRDSEFVGYFPEYDSDEVRTAFLLSDPIGSGPLGLVERADAPVRWATLADLAAFRIGVVQDYVNTADFDRRVREHKQPVDLAADDIHNLLKVAARRIPLAVIDQRVFDYLARHDPQVARVAPQLHFNGRLLEDKLLFICFRRTPEGERVRQLVNEGLKKIDVEAVMAAAFK